MKGCEDEAKGDKSKGRSKATSRSNVDESQDMVAEYGWMDENRNGIMIYDRSVCVRDLW